MKKQILAMGALLAAALMSAGDAEAQRRVLVYGPGGQSAINDLRTNVPSVRDAGPTQGQFTIATEAMWRSMTTAQFASYNAIWIDGGNCATPADQGNALFQAVTDTRGVWSGAITGHFEIIGSDSDLHIGPSRKFLTNSYHYVTSGSGTGLFVSTSCLYYQAAANTPVPWLQGIGDFRVTGDGCTDGQLLEPGSATHPVHIGITRPSSTIVLPGDLAWGCFTHSHFNQHPPSFQRVYSIGSLGPGRGVVIVNDRGGCVIDADCLPGQFCNRDAMGGDPTCRTTRGNGSPCAVGTECTSGVCAEGVCCNSACSGQCESCRNAGSVGLCSATTGAPIGTRAACINFGTTCGGRCNGSNRTECTYPPSTVVCVAASCSGGVASSSASCDGRGVCGTPRRTDCNPYVCGPTACLTRCATDTDCSTGLRCQAGTCVTRIPAGMGCTTSAQCATGNCIDGVCCNTACGGQCEACDVPGSLGVCSPVSGAPHAARRACGGSGVCAGTCDGSNRATCTFPNDQAMCGMPSCTAGTETTVATCDGLGTCATPRMRDCGRYACGPTACRTSCDTDVECAAGNYCREGMCVPRQPNGGACTMTAECASGNCVDGVCCNTACDGQCEACDNSGSVGTCSPTMGAPRGTRPGCAGAGSCAGTCDGSSRTNCAYPGSSVECRAASCAEGQATNRGTCDGAGGCGSPTTAPCAPYTCEGAMCRASCTAASDCVTGYRCEMGRCVPTGNLGTPCTRNDQCSMGAVCAGGVCCNTACQGACESCVLPGRAGTCSPLPAGIPPGDAGASCACDGVRGTCREIPDAGTPDVPTMDAGPAVIIGYQGSGCGCSAPGNRASGSALGLAVAALALVAARRRRR